MASDNDDSIPRRSGRTSTAKRTSLANPITDDGDVADDPAPALPAADYLKDALTGLSAAYSDIKTRAALKSAWRSLVAAYCIDLRGQPFNFPQFVRSKVDEATIIEALEAEFGTKELGLYHNRKPSSTISKLARTLGLDDARLLALWFGANNIRIPGRDSHRRIFAYLSSGEFEKPEQVWEEHYPDIMARWAGRMGLDLDKPRGRVRCVFARMPFQDLPRTPRSRLSPKDFCLADKDNDDTASVTSGVPTAIETFGDESSPVSTIAARASSIFSNSPGSFDGTGLTLFDDSSNLDDDTQKRRADLSFETVMPKRVRVEPAAAESMAQDEVTFAAEEEDDIEQLVLDQLTGTGAHRNSASGTGGRRTGDANTARDIEMSVQVIADRADEPSPIHPLQPGARIPQREVTPAIVQQVLSTSASVQRVQQTSESQPRMMYATTPAAQQFWMNDPSNSPSTSPRRQPEHLPVNFKAVETNLSSAAESMISVLEKPGSWLNGAIMTHILIRIASTSLGYGFIDLPADLPDPVLSSEKFARTVSEGKLLGINRFLAAVNVNAHWVLVVLQTGPEQRTQPRENAEQTVPLMQLYIYDSMSAPISMIHRTVVDRVQRLLPSNMELLVQRPECPQQPDSNSCGVYALVFSLFLVTDVQMPATLDINRWRLVLLAIVKGSTLGSVLPQRLAQMTHPTDLGEPLTAGAFTYTEMDDTSPSGIAKSRLQDLTSLFRQTCSSVAGLIEWYTSCRDDVTQAIQWTDAEAAPVVACLLTQTVQAVAKLNKGVAEALEDIEATRTIFNMASRMHGWMSLPELTAAPNAATIESRLRDLERGVVLMKSRLELAQLNGAAFEKLDMVKCKKELDMARQQYDLECARAQAILDDLPFAGLIPP